MKATAHDSVKQGSVLDYHTRCAALPLQIKLATLHCTTMVTRANKGYQYISINIYENQPSHEQLCHHRRAASQYI